MGLINWIFDLYQHGQIDEARTDAAEARATAAAIRGAGGRVDVERLERALGELALATRTLQRLMVDKGVCSADEVAAMLRRVDLEDGSADGRTPLPG
jgi:hypothetical protein